MSNITDLSKLFRGLVDDMDAEDVNRSQVPQMAPQQFIPPQETSQELAFQQNMDPSKLMPVDTAFNQQYTPESFDNIGVVPPVQMNIPQPTMPTVVEAAQSFPDAEGYTSAGYFPEVPQLDVPQVYESSVHYRLPDVPKYQVELNAPPTVRGEDQSQFDADVEGSTRVANTRVLYDRAIQPLASGGLPTKGGMKSKAILGGGLFNRASGYFTDTPDQESQRELTVEVRDYFDRDDVRKRIEADPKALALLERDPIGYYQSLTNDTVDEYTEEQPFTLEPNVPELEGSNIPAVEPVVDPSLLRPDGEEDLVEQDAANAEAEKEITVKEAETVVKTIEPTLKKDADKVIESLGEKEDDEPEESFLKRVWNGVSGFFKEQLDDPKVRRTLFAYIASRAVGYDGVTFAGQVLENEWKQEAAQKKLDNAEKVAQKKQEFELEKIYGKEVIAERKKLIDDQTIDFSKTAEIYDTVNQRNLTGSFSKNGQLISLDNPEAFGLTPENRVVLVAALRQMTDGQYILGKGDTSQDIQKELTSYVSDNLSNTILNVVSNVTQRRGLESKDEKALEARIRGSLTTSQLEGGVTLFTSMLPANTNYDTPEMRLALNNGIEQYAIAIADGRSSAGSKQLAGFLEMQQIKSDSRNRISDGFLAIPELKGATDKTGINVFSKASNKVKNLKSAFADYNKMDPNRVNKTAMWSNLERLYNEQEAAQGTAFTEHWLGASDASVKKGNEEAASPQLLWVMSLGNTSSKFNAGSLKDIVPKL